MPMFAYMKMIRLLILSRCIELETARFYSGGFRYGKKFKNIENYWQMDANFSIGVDIVCFMGIIILKKACNIATNFQ